VAFHPLAHAFRLGGGPSRAAHAALAGLWALLVWGVIGTAIARIAGLELATGKRPSLWRSLRFAVPRTGTSAAVAAIPLLLALFPLAIVGGVIGLLYRLGAAGQVAGGVLAWIPLLLGLLAAVLLLGFVAGWPLMIASIAVEAEDAFDALSRAFSYVFQNPALLALLAGVAWLAGTAGVLLVALTMRVAVALAAWGLALGAPPGQVAAKFGPLQVHPDSISAAIHSGWMGFVSLLAYGWVYSFFWSAAVLIYLALRRAIDGTPTDDIGPAESTAPTLVPETTDPGPSITAPSTDDPADS
jgi:hypothetical protein